MAHGDGGNGLDAKEYERRSRFESRTSERLDDVESRIPRIEEVQKEVIEVRVMVKQLDKLVVTIHDKLHQFVSKESQRFDNVVDRFNERFDEVLKLLKKRGK